MMTMNAVCRIYLALLMLAGTAGLAAAQDAPAQDTVDGIIQCAKIPDRDQRLTCYDRRVNDLVIGIQSGAVRTEPLAAPGARTVSRQPSQVAVQPKAKKRPFWAFWGLKKEPGKKDQRLEMRSQLAGHSVDPLGRYVFRLANGQIWKQKSARTLVLKDGQEVVVKPGTMGSFRLVIGRNPPVQVTRIK